MYEDIVNLVLRPQNLWIDAYTYDIDESRNIGIRLRYDEQNGKIEICKYHYYPTYGIYRVKSFKIIENNGIKRTRFLGDLLVEINYENPLFKDTSLDDYIRQFIAEFGPEPEGDDLIEFIQEE